MERKKLIKKEGPIVQSSKNEPVEFIERSTVVMMCRGYYSCMGVVHYFCGYRKLLRPNSLS